MNDRLEVAGLATGENHVAPGQCRCDHQCPCFNPVGQYSDGYRFEFGNPFYNHDRRTGTADIGSHLHQHVCQGFHFRFTGSIAEHGSSFGKNGSHHQVFRPGHGGNIQIDLIAFQLRCLGFNIPVFQVNVRPQPGQSFQMEIDGPGTYGAPSGEGYTGLFEPCQDGSQHQYRRPHLADQIIGGFMVANPLGIDAHRVAVGLDFRPEIG